MHARMLHNLVVSSPTTAVRTHSQIAVLEHFRTIVFISQDKTYQVSSTAGIQYQQHVATTVDI